ncbi:hypothetical protein ACJMK2_013437, partial [Sinanodonta woodiana]
MGDMKDINYTSTTANLGLNELPDTISTVSEWKCYDSYRYCTNGTHITIEEEEGNVTFWQ